ncbi:MAG: CHAT domain-containing protein, partial [Bacteroidia bacterium]
MSQAIRNVLMDYWQQSARGKNDAKVPQIEKVAAFLLQYIKVYRSENHKIYQSFRDAQEWMALSYLQPQKAATMMKTAMKNAVEDINRAPDDTMMAAEMMRLVEISKRAGDRYNMQLLAPNQSSPASFQQLTQSAEQLKKVVMGQVEHLNMAELTPFMSDAADKNAVVMEVPDKVMAKMPSSEKEIKPTLFAIFIGDFKADATQNSIIVFEENVRREIKELNGFISIKVRIAPLSDEIHSILNSLFDETKPEDSVFIYEQKSTTSPVPLDKMLLDFYNEKNRLLPYTTAFINVTYEFEKLPSEKLIFLSGIYLNGAADTYFFGINAQSKGRLPLQKLVATFSQNNQNQLRQYSTSPLIVDVAPRLYAAPSAAKRPFLAVKNEVLEIQYLLRSLGIYDASTNGIFNKATDDALKASFQEKNLPLPSEKSAIIPFLAQAEKEKETTDKPLYIFVFANPDQKLPYTIEERAALEGILRETIEANNAEAFFLHDPDKQEVMEYFTKPEYRNRMQIFHFSGFDSNLSNNTIEHVLYLKENQEIQFDDLMHWLDFQEHIQFIFLNSCRLRNFAKNLTLRGVAAVIAAEGVIMDDYAFKFAKEFYDELQEGKTLAEAFAEAKKDDEQQFYSNTNAHRAIQQEQSQSYGEPEPPQNNFELLLNWAKQPNTLAWRLKTAKTEAKQRVDEVPSNHLLVISINQY